MTIRSTATVPYALQEAVVQACGTVFWYKRPLKALLVRAGVPRPLVQKYSDASKFIMEREVLAELDSRGEHGIRVQHQLVRELAAMRTVPDPDNQQAGLRALRDLRELARELGIIETDRPAKSQSSRRQRAEEKQRALEVRGKGLQELHGKYMELALAEGDPQGRGYDLQDLLEALSSYMTFHTSRPTARGLLKKRTASSRSAALTT